MGGFDPFSLAAFPGGVAAVLLPQGCNFRCSSCPNDELVLPELFSETYAWGWVEGFLQRRRGQLDGVVVTGGEPTLHAGLCDLLERLRMWGYEVKLDTNGSRPDVLASVLAEELVDMVAMDVKAPLGKYRAVAGVSVSGEVIVQSIDLLKNSRVHHQFRTTVDPDLLSEEDVARIRSLLGAETDYVVHQAILDKTPTLAQRMNR